MNKHDPEVTRLTYLIMYLLFAAIGAIVIGAAAGLTVRIFFALSGLTY